MPAWWWSATARRRRRAASRACCGTIPPPASCAMPTPATTRRSPAPRRTRSSCQAWLDREASCAMRVVICGGGVIGSAIAYFLSCRGVEVTVIERAGIANAASGKSGGFLALDWCDGTPLAALARRSFALHASLADTVGADWGYRRLATYGGFASAHGGGRASGGVIDWVADSVSVD